MADKGIQYASSCLDDHDPNSLPVDQALQNILSETKSIDEQVTVPIKEALGRTLAQNVKASLNVPGHTNSAMDGYAVNANDLPKTGKAELKIVGKAFAGHGFSGQVSSGECVRIMTGATLPAGSDTIVIQERAVVEGDKVWIGDDNQPRQNVRCAGEDIAIGETVLVVGKLLLPADIGLLASLGVTEVAVKRQLKVAFFSTGDELIPSGEPLQEGQIYDSNRYVLYALLTKMGVIPIDLGIVKDTAQAIEQAFQQAAEQADVVITSGGVSVGEADFIRDILNKLGHIHFWKVAIKPGRPLAFGHLKQALYFGLPGNPVSVMVTFYVLVRPSLQKMMGQTPRPPLIIKAQCTSDLSKRPGRTEYQRGSLQANENNEYSVSKTGAQGSGILSSMSAANCLIVLPELASRVQAGSTVTVIPFDSIV